MQRPEKTQNLVYVDLGPWLRATRLPVSTHTLNDDHVQYAQLNYQNDDKKQETMDVYSVGKFYRYQVLMQKCNQYATVHIETSLLQYCYRVNKF